MIKYSVSLTDPDAKVRNLLNSKSESLPQPSEKFVAIDAEDFLVWEVKP